MRPTSWDRFKFDPTQEATSLIPLLEAVIKEEPRSNKDWRRILKRHRRRDEMFFSKSQMIEGFRQFQHSHKFDVSEEAFLSLIRMKPTRTQSGVAPITVLTKPFPCPGQCIFCPNDVRMPKSYLANEPGAQRAARNRFDPYAQTWNRLTAFHKMGHSTAKVELIVLGGTWSSYPRPYQIYFIARCFEAVSDFGLAYDPQPYDAPVLEQPDFLDIEHRLVQAPGREESVNLYNRTVSRHLRHHLNGQLVASHEEMEWHALFEAHRVNENAPSRIVGLVIETRPDEIDVAEVEHFRRLGATKVQIGIQNLNDEVLAANRRGHDVAKAREALGLLRQGGFKVQAHWMANLYKATVDGDVEDYARLFDDEWIRPDELKLYPCSLIPHTELMSHYEAGRWKPYEREELLDLLVRSMPITPEYCRLSRVIRDIPADSMHTDSHGTNFREVAEAEIERRELKLAEIRAREVKTRQFSGTEVIQRIMAYDTAVSEERFVQFESEGKLLGFVRLSLPTRSPIFSELEACAMIREVHVYGQSLAFGEESGARVQHRGLGTRLIEKAASIAASHGFTKLAVISSVGTRGYYRRLGFFDGDLYQIKSLAGLRDGVVA